MQDTSPISSTERELTQHCTVVAIDMGYGHLRPARSVAERLGTTVLHADRAPVADQEERRRWSFTRRFYELVTRVSGAPWVGPPIRAVLNSLTDIPHLYPFRDLSRPNLGVRMLEQSARQGLGRTMVTYLQERNSALITTFYSPAVLADYHGYDRIFCIVTDSDVNRVWAPIHPRQSNIHYFAPSGRVVRRLRAYGVAKEQVEFTGFPLPHSLVGGPEAGILKRNLAARLVRLDPKRVFMRQFAEDVELLGPHAIAEGPPRLTFAVGGTGAQADLPGLFLPSLEPLLKSGELALTLVAGVRKEVLSAFQMHVERSGLENEVGKSIQFLCETDHETYFDRFDACLAETDVLWTKPSELVFYAGLGLPLILSRPVGIHESYNLRWARENGAGLKQRDPRTIGERLRELLNDGNLAAAAWAGFRRIPHRGLYQIIDRATKPRST